MAALSVQVPFPVFYDLDGQPLDNGNIYIGIANLDPVTNPLQVYYDEALTITASQPIKTSNGYIYRNGTPAQIYVNASNFSITVNDSKNLLVYNFPDVIGIGSNADTIEYDPPFTGAVTSGYTIQDKLEQYVSVKDFGAVGDGVTDDTDAIQAAIDYAGIVNNTGGPIPGSPTANVYVPRGTYRIGKITLSPGISFWGAGRDVTIFQVKAGHADVIIDMKRPTSILSSRTRNYSIQEFTILGDSTAGQIGINIYQVAEISIRNVNISSCDYGILSYDVVTGKIDRCKIQGCTTRGAFLRDGSNGLEISNTRFQTTTNGANIEIDGALSPGGATSLLTLGVHLNNCIIESALSNTNGIGVLIGGTNSAVNILLSGCYFENNKVSAVDVGSATSTGTSTVTITAGNFAAVGVASAYGIRNYGGLLSVDNAWLDGIPTTANRLLMESSTGSANPRLWNLTNTIPTGTKASTAINNGFGFGNSQYFQTAGISFYDDSSDYGNFIRRTSDVAFQGVGKYLWVQTEFRTSYQGTGLLVSGVFDVVFSTATANASYAITLGSEGNNHLKISNKTINGFRISAVDSAGVVQTGDTSRVHWHLFRNQ